MRRLTRVSVGGLFGYVTHDIHLRVDSPTIMTGPNGVGKTHVLRLVRNLLALDVRDLSELPFESCTLEFSDKKRLAVAKDLEGEVVLLRFTAYQGRKKLGSADVRIDELDDAEAELPPYVRQRADGRWYDARENRPISNAMMERRYGITSFTDRSPFEKGSPVLDCVAGIAPILIDTKRLDNQPARRTDMSARTLLGPTTPIAQYIGAIRSQVVDARRESVAQTQSADLSFALRALAAAGSAVNKDDLRDRYSGIVEKYEDLTQNRLALGEAPPDFPEHVTPTVRRILDIFLDDWEARLEPLLPLNDKLKVLRRILDEKFAVTGKRTIMSAQGSLGFVGHGGSRVGVGSLSSGEQHLVALFTLLLFSARPESLVLIDEPELSMHAAWKHAFLRDISEVAALASLQVVLATHSSAIVHGNWEMTEELSPGAPPETQQIEPLPESEEWGA